MMLGLPRPIFTTSKPAERKEQTPCRDAVLDELMREQHGWFESSGLRPVGGTLRGRKTALPLSACATPKRFNRDVGLNTGMLAPSLPN
jgi:hypothetical protein